MEKRTKRSNSLDSHRRGSFLSLYDEVKLSDGDTVALWDPLNNSVMFSPNDPAELTRRSRVVFSKYPFAVGEIFQVYVKLRERHPFESETFNVPRTRPRSCGHYANFDNLAIGFCTTDPNNLLDLPYDGVVKNWSECCEFWILSENKVYCNKEKETRPNLSIFNPKSSKIGCSVNEKGYLEFHMDDKNHGVVWSKPLPMDRPLWGFVDLPIEYKIQACFTHGNLPSHWIPQESQGLPTPNEIEEMVVSKFDERIGTIEQQLKEVQQDQKQILSILRENQQKSTEHTAEKQSQYPKELFFNPNHLDITDNVLGVGSYSEVRQGMYHGGPVAVKKFHRVIISDYNRELFEREVRIASRVHHSNLITFIGAMTTEDLCIVSELMETSLRQMIEAGEFKESYIGVVIKNVGCALDYLHCLPQPVVHRDVSSANVLINKLERGLQVKLGDFGSANFLAQLQTVGPGCPTYAAPEAGNPMQQGPKMDVYSFGVLLFEMCIGRFPDRRYLEDLKKDVDNWSNDKKKFFGKWAKRCTERDPDKRPTMSELMGNVNDSD